MTWRCPDCKGSGFSVKHLKTTCVRCKGMGTIDLHEVENLEKEREVHHREIRNTALDAFNEARKSLQIDGVAAVERHDADSLLASATDLLNSWAREMSVAEARDEKDIKGVIDRLWSEISSRLFSKPMKQPQKPRTLSKNFEEHNMPHTPYIDSVYLGKALNSLEVSNTINRAMETLKTVEFEVVFHPNYCHEKTH